MIDFRTNIYSGVGAENIFIGYDLGDLRLSSRRCLSRDARHGDILHGVTGDIRHETIFLVSVTKVVESI